jgi:predicted Zn-dependent peptidase
VPATHTQIRLGRLGVSSRHNEFAALNVLNAALARGMGSQLHAALRNGLGHVYEVHGQSPLRQDAGPWTISTAMANDKVGDGLRAVFRCFEQIRERVLTREQHQITRNRLRGESLRNFECHHQIALKLIGALGPPARGTRAEPEEIMLRAGDEPSWGDVNRIAARFLAPSEFTIVLAGPTDTLRPQLRGISPITVIDKEQWRALYEVRNGPPGRT